MLISPNTWDEQHFFRAGLPLQMVHGTDQLLVGVVLLCHVPQALPLRQAAHDQRGPPPRLTVGEQLHRCDGGQRLTACFRDAERYGLPDVTAAAVEGHLRRTEKGAGGIP